MSTYDCRNQRARPIVIDPGLYHSKKSGVFWAKEKRSLPASFKLFTGIVFGISLCYQSFFTESYESEKHTLNRFCWFCLSSFYMLVIRFWIVYGEKLSCYSKFGIKN